MKKGSIIDQFDEEDEIDSKKGKDKVDLKEDKRLKKYSFLSREMDSLDVEKEYFRLKQCLELGARRMNYIALAEAIDAATSNAFSAGMIYAIARDMREEFENGEYAIKWSELTEEAMETLEKLKKSGKISGQISDNKMRSWIVKNKYEEYNEIITRLRKLQTNERILSTFKDQWESRKSLLQSQGRIVEKKVVVQMGKDDDIE